MRGTYGFILLVKVINVAIQYLHKELDGHGGVHARICYPQSAL
jgi:hypothetical protein